MRSRAPKSSDILYPPKSTHQMPLLYPVTVSVRLSVTYILHCELWLFFLIKYVHHPETILHTTYYIYMWRYHGVFLVIPSFMKKNIGLYSGYAVLTQLRNFVCTILHGAIPQMNWNFTNHIVLKSQVIICNCHEM